MTDTNKLAAWLCLKSNPEIKLRTALAILERYPDPRDFVGKSEHPLFCSDLLNITAKQYLMDGTLPHNFEGILKLCKHYEIDILCITDGGYPSTLKEIFAPPLMLYYRGGLLQALKSITLGVVGTRKPTSYGIQMCRKLLEPVCAKGVCIVSGLAMGIDSIAHSTAVKAKTPTIAVLASGVDNIYPPQNRELAAKIIANGALVSEYDPGTKAEKWNFPARNRIVSALSQACFIVEGPITSGALLTAKFALEQNRDLIALPGNVNHPNAQGPNYLIKNGAALITEAEDILHCLGVQTDAEVSEQLDILPDIFPDEVIVLDFFKQEQREIHFDELIVQTGHSFGKLSTILLNLELKGYLAKSGGSSFILG
ncbi:MAG: DNA-processing protein DprA [Candidatus Cloacimonadaceae bacterium]|nr:DNA-processing protein DprA [Candidatus Cloacimonadaceae bacterium]